MRVRWTLEALNDLNEAIAYIAEFEDRVTPKVLASVIKVAAKSLGKLPNRGRAACAESVVFFRTLGTAGTG